MTTVTKFDTATLKSIRVDLNAALAEVAKKHGIVMSAGSMSYRENSFTCKVTAVTKAGGGVEQADKDTSGTSNAKWQKAFLDNCVFMGLKKSDLGATFKMSGENVTIVGARPKANQPIVISRNGKFVATSVASVKFAMSA